MKVLKRFLDLFRRRRLEAEMAEEMKAHVELQANLNLKTGMSPEEARYVALRQFGNVTAIQQQAREGRGWMVLEHLGQDLRQAVRTMRRSPGLTLVIIGSLALGIGANTTLFTLTDAVLRRNLPVPAPDRLVFLERHPGSVFGGSKKFCDISVPLMQAMEERAPVLAGVTTFYLHEMTAIRGSEADPVTVLIAAENLFPVLGVRPASGRLFQPGDAKEEKVAVLGHRYWQRVYEGRPVVGEGIVLNGESYTIVGVGPPEFFGLVAGEAFDVSIPLPERHLPARGRSSTDPSAQSLKWVLGRLDDAVTLEQAGRSLTGLLQEMMVAEGTAESDPERFARNRIEVRSAAQGIEVLQGRYSQPLRVLSALVALVLLLTGVNVANLLLAQATAREHEMAVRVALGAGRGRLLRQMLSESTLLACAGGVLGLLLAQWAAPAMLHLLARDAEPLLLDVSLNWRALGFTALVVMGVGLLAGTAPAWRFMSEDRIAPPGGGMRGSKPTPRLASVLVVVQVALATVLLVAAGLFVRSFQNLAKLDPGFHRDGLLLVKVDPVIAGIKGAPLADLYVRMIERLEATPGVISATFERNQPLGGGWTASTLFPVGFTPAPGAEPFIRTEDVGPRYFETLGMQLRTGRDFQVADNRNAPRVVVINESAAALFFPGEDALGRRLAHTVSKLDYEIVGVAADARHVSLRRGATPMAYYAVLQSEAIRETTLHIRVAGDPLAFARDVRRIIREVDSRVPVMNVTTLAAVSDASLARERVTATLAGAFGGLALLLAGVGVGGLLSFAVARRTHEIGIRMAMGADGPTVVIMILRGTLRLVAAGVMVGIPGAWIAGQAMHSLLFGLSPADPVTLSTTVVALTLVGVGATWLPARRAAKVDPVIALRAE
jgi:predicted permease